MSIYFIINKKCVGQRGNQRIQQRIARKARNELQVKYTLRTVYNQGFFIF